MRFLLRQSFTQLSFPCRRVWFIAPLAPSITRSNMPFSSLSKTPWFFSFPHQVVSRPPVGSCFFPLRISKAVTFPPNESCSSFKSFFPYSFSHFTIGFGKPLFRLLNSFWRLLHFWIPHRWDNPSLPPLFPPTALRPGLRPCCETSSPSPRPFPLAFSRGAEYTYDGRIFPSSLCRCGDFPPNCWLYFFFCCSALLFGYTLSPAMRSFSPPPLPA